MEPLNITWLDSRFFWTEPIRLPWDRVLNMEDVSESNVSLCQSVGKRTANALIVYTFQAVTGSQGKGERDEKMIEEA